MKELDWDDLRYFIAVAEHGSLRAGANVLGTTATTVAAHIKTLETCLGDTLFEVGRDGAVPTRLGQSLFRDAKDIEAQIIRISEKAQSSLEKYTGSARIGLTEGIGTYWVLPRLVNFQRTYPNVCIKTICSMSPIMDIGKDVDMAIQFKPPRDPDLMITRLGWLHVMFFASKGYKDLFGLPSHLGELAQHKLVAQASDQLDLEKLFAAIGIKDPDTVVSFWVDTSSGNYELISKGAGIGILPTYAAALGADLQAVEIGPGHYTYDIWLTYSRTALRSPAKTALIDYVKTCFDAKRFPWFGEECISPGELAALPKTDWIINLPAPLRL